MIWGKSLGTGVAVELATEKKIDGLILEAPYTSTVDIAAAIYPIFPVRLLMKDQFRSDERIGKVSVPLLVLHGARDQVVPIAYGEKLFSLAHEPKKFVRFPRGGARGSQRLRLGRIRARVFECAEIVFKIEIAGTSPAITERNSGNCISRGRNRRRHHRHCRRG